MTVAIFLGSLLGAMAIGMPIAMALLVCGVAQSAPGAEQPLSVVVARLPSLPDGSSEPPYPSPCGPGVGTFGLAPRRDCRVSPYWQVQLFSTRT